MELLAFIFCSAGLLLLFGFSAQDFEHRQRTKKLRQKVRAAKAKPRKDPVRAMVQEVKQILAIQGMQGAMTAVWGASVGLSICGVVVCRLLGNLFLAPVVVAVCWAVPFFVIKLQWQHKERRFTEELEAALGSITTSYLRGNNTILAAVQENIPTIKAPVSQVFRLFVVQATLIDSRTETALLAMKRMVHNGVFHEWVDAVIRCQADHKLKNTLPPILEKFSDERTVEAETAVIMDAPRRTFWIMLATACVAPALVWFIYEDWGRVLFETVPGKLLLTLHFAVVAVTFFVGLYVMQPVAAKGAEK